MKKLIALVFCFTVMAAVARAEYPKAPGRSTPIEDAVTQKVKAAQQAEPVKIPGGKRLVTVTLEVQQPEEDEQYVLHRYWHCPAVIFNKDGALAFDAECWKAFTEASKLTTGPAVRFKVNLGKLGKYKKGENAGEAFFFESSYTADGAVPRNEDDVEAFKLSDDRTFIIYNLSLFNDPENSEVKQAFAAYYQENNLQEVTAQTLSQYFKGTHPLFKRELKRQL